MLYLSVMKSIDQQWLLFLRYSISGFLSFACELILLYFLLFAFGQPYYYAVPLAFFIATTVQWAICHWWVFRSSGRHLETEYTYFVAILISGLFWTTVLVALLVHFFDLDVLLARIVAGCFTGLWDYYLNARFNFRAHPFLRF